MVKNPPSNAGDTGSIPGRGTKIPHATGQLSPLTATIEFACLNERETPSRPRTVMKKIPLAKTKIPRAATKT